MSPPDVPAMRKPSMPYGKRPIRPGNSTQQRESFDSNKNEAAGEQAYERISQQARRIEYKANAQRAVDTVFGRGKPAARDKAAIHDSPSSNGLKRTGVLHRNKSDSDNNGEARDIAEAVARSLVDNEGAAPEAADIAKAITMSLSTHNKPPSPSRAVGTYDVLEVLRDVMEACMKCLDESIQEQEMVSACQMAACIKSWQSTISSVVYAATTAEDQRIKDLKVQLCFDQKVQENHQKEISKLNQMWGAKVLEMQCEWQKQMVKTCEAQIAEQKSASLYKATLDEQHRIVEHSHLRTVKSALSYVHDEVSQLSRDLAALRSEHAATITELKKRLHESSFLKQKAERLADANTALRQAQNTKDNEKKQETEKLIQTYEARVKTLQGTAMPVEANTVSRPTQGRATPSELFPSKTKEPPDKEQAGCQPTRSDPTRRPGSSVSPHKRKLDGDMSSQAEGVDQPRKRAKARSME
ncbi:hypothetical protein PTNB73_07351 [Pyrenophora teres f. teres]|nr:hypothetical protein PTNB85_09527 [Pyrenophora teres f. teres]KAE8835465.1 hypothetical protein HRS9122_07735 [Pyrenophora teres f. teres]KAE8861797.1 hypothetical protein PTNB73_07351 [Pyrenophora teres f. teres]